MPHAEYRRLLTRAYDVDKPEAPAEELAFYREMASRTGGPALEAMCGSGRFLLPLLAEGFDVDGIDASADMLASCRTRGGELVDDRLFHQTVQTMTLPRQYSFIFCGGGSFGLLTGDDDITRALSKLFGASRPGGLLALEVETPFARPRLRPGTWGGRWWRCPNDEVIVLRHLQGPVDEHGEQGLGIYELYRDGALIQTELNEWSRRFWRADEIRDVVTKAGFEDVVVTRAFTDIEPDDEAEMLTVRAMRPNA